MKYKAITAVMLTLLLIGVLTIAFSIQPVNASKPLAPNGVHDMATYESRIGEQGFLFEDENLQMWVPASYENHSGIIFDYLAAGYTNLSSIFGDHEYPYKFSVEHYPPGSPYLWGGTDGRGTIRYGYSNLEDDTPEWNDYGVPHVIGYYEEMAHCFVYDFGVIGEISVGFYETLGLMIGSEVTLRAAYNPYTEGSISDYYQVCNETTSYYLEHNAGPPGVPDNIWPTRVLSWAFKSEVVDVYGWSAFTNTFNYLQLEGYPLKKYDRDHTWGGFLNYLGNQTSSDLNTVFAGYGLPSLEWFEGDGYQKGMMQIDDNHYSFRVKCFDREGDQPSHVKLHVYSTPYYENTMSFIGGNNGTGWLFEANVTFLPYRYAFSANDGAHNVFQAVGLPTLMSDAHNIAVTSITTNKTVVTENSTVTINVTVSNPGNYEETFNLTVYANTNIVATFTNITLTSGNSTTITFKWNTTGIAKGDHTISANASVVPGEIYIADNTKVADDIVTVLTSGHDIAIKSVVPSKTVVGLGYNLTLNVTAKNYGVYEETFNITVYANETIINTFINLTLTSGNSATITFKWNTTGFPLGNYTISANATTVPGETYTADNTYRYDIIRVNTPGDVKEKFGIVDIFDLVYVGIHYGAEKGKPPPPSTEPYEPEADINDDDIIDIFDIVIIGIHYGETYP